MDPSSVVEVRRAALEAYDVGLCPLPIRLDGSKRPAVRSWEELLTTRPERGQVEAAFIPPRGLGIVCGVTSGNLEMLEFEGAAVAAGAYDEWLSMVFDSPLAAAAVRVVEGYSERSPSGGMHLLWRVDNGPVPGNTKLARYVDDAGKVRVTAETRGQGGYVIVAPTPGRGHTSGRPWEQLEGSFTTIPTLTGAERIGLLTFARLLDTAPEAAALPHTPRREPPAGTLSPGDDFNDRADWLRDVLEGWQIVRRKGDTLFVCKPGSNPRDGHHATINHAGSAVFYNFSTTAWPFEAQESYTKFGAYALLQFDGDFKAAARELGRRGYGTKAERRITRRRWRHGEG